MDLLMTGIDYTRLVNKFIDIGEVLSESIDYDAIFIKRSNIKKTSIDDFINEAEDYEIRYNNYGKLKSKYRLRILINDLNQIYGSDIIKRAENDLYLTNINDFDVIITNFCIACYLLNTLIFYYNNKLHYKLYELNSKTNFVLQYEAQEKKMSARFDVSQSICRVLVNYLYEYAKYPLLKCAADYYMFLSKNKWLSPFNICKTCGRIVEDDYPETYIQKTHCNNCLYPSKKGDKSADLLEHEIKYKSSVLAYEFFMKCIDILRKYYPNEKTLTIITNNSKSICCKKYQKELINSYEQLAKEITVAYMIEKYKKRNRNKKDD